MKTRKNLCLAILAFSLLGTPALAQSGRSNSGGTTRGIPRSDQVQAENKKTDKDTVKKTRTRELGEKDQAHG